MRNRFLLVAAASLLATLPAFARGYHGHGWSTSTHGALRSCDDITVDADDYQVARDEDQYTVPKGNGTLSVNPGQNGGVVVRGGSDAKDYQVTVCKFAGGRDEAAAKSALAQVSAKASNNAIHAQGPGGSDSDDDATRWMVYLIIQAPRDAAMELETHNGPLSVEDYSGRITARTQNGPLALKNISGEAKADVQNGPVSISGSSGKASISAQNGPLSVDLTGSRWDGEGLTASTVNGPVSVRVPENYASGVEVESDGHSPMRCSAKQCDQQSSRTWDEDHRRIAINGNSPAVVKVSTVNGPVSVDNRHAAY